MQKKGKWIENRLTLEKVENGIGSGNLGGKKYLMKVIINMVRKGIKEMEDKLISLTARKECKRAVISCIVFVYTK